MHSIEFSLTLDDLRAFQRFHFRSLFKVTGRGTTRWIIIIVLLGMLFVILNHDRTDEDGERSIFISLIITFLPLALILGVIWFFIMRAIRLGRDAGDMRRFTALQRLRLIDDGMEFTSEFGSSVLHWNGIHHLEQMPDYLFVYTASNSAHIVPARAFATPSHFHEFVSTVSARHQMTPPLHSICPNCNYSLEQADRRGCPECGWQRAENELTKLL